MRPNRGQVDLVVGVHDGGRVVQDEASRVGRGVVEILGQEWKVLGPPNVPIVQADEQEDAAEPADQVVHQGI